jgi:endonuclease/exonuclease/phosphatase family metal-dependent hydrolase
LIVRIHRKFLLSIFFGLVLVEFAAAADLALQFVAETTIPGDLEIDDTLVGGLSGLTYDPGCDLYYAVSDDRGRFGPSRFYTLKISRTESAKVDFIAAVGFRDREGMLFGRNFPDPEALALDSKGSLYVASEGVPHRGIPPFVGFFALDGSLHGELSLPEHFVPDELGTRGVRDNLGFEGLAISPEGNRLFVVAENALLQDGPTADLTHGSPTRLLVIDRFTGHTIAEYLYPIDPVPDEPQPASAFRTNGVSEILAIDDFRLLVVERSFSAGVGNRVRLYMIDLESAANVSGTDGFADAEDLESVFVSKTLVADLHQLGVRPDNIEGMAFGPTLEDGRRLLVMISDNNFQPSVQANQVLLFAVSGLPSSRVEPLHARIHEVQGAGHVSPLVGRCVSALPGVVTAILGEGRGQAFWIQDPQPDDEVATSDGLLVTALDGLPMVAVGDSVRLGGRVEERVWGMELPVTRLVASEVEIASGGNELPTAVTVGEKGRMIPENEVAAPGLASFDPSRYAADFFESLEGMRVQVNEPVVIGPTSRYGEAVVLTDGGSGAGPRTARRGLRSRDGVPSPLRIMISNQLVPPPTDLSVGESLASGFEAILHYTYGSYKLLNLEPLPPAIGVAVKPEKTTLRGDGPRLTIATFNLENLSSRSPDEKFTRLAEAIADNLGSPDIVAVQEVQDDSGPEDDGTVSSDLTLAKLVRAIEAAGGARYDVRSVEPNDGADGGQPGANIRNAFLFNPQRVEFPDRGENGEGREAMILGSSFLGSNPGLIAPRDPAFARREDGRGGSRKPLIGEFRFAGHPLYLINLHLVSKGGDDQFFGRRQPPRAGSTERRLAQAEVVARFVDLLLERDPDAQVVVLGDLNDFEDSIPIKALERVGLEDLIKRLPTNERYSYVFQGTSQVLDHILISQALANGAEVDAVHLNAEFPAARRSSDHDPVLVRLAY